ncbi:hypothetical protein SCOCK_200099 [Actinacidiphila cocklensis]|uniref:Uncharacterized protein n=1 Tax=Actinacidiphila cocklensis TaxID=887465 RepID=A0A9W4DPU0_9ACTN|nr:hypothetical protein SCOCK_200099 [Actinacidiphila cocklensis]
MDDGGIPVENCPQPVYSPWDSAVDNLGGRPEYTRRPALSSSIACAGEKLFPPDQDRHKRRGGDHSTQSPVRVPIALHLLLVDD